MEIKKSPEADLEKGKGLSLLLGLVVALSLTFVSLECVALLPKQATLMELATRPKWKKRSSSRKSNLRISLKSLSHRSSPSRPRSSYLRNSRS